MFTNHKLAKSVRLACAFGAAARVYQHCASIRDHQTKGGVVSQIHLVAIAQRADDCVDTVSHTLYIQRACLGWACSNQEVKAD